MQYPPEFPIPVEPEIETAHAGEFVAELRCLRDALSKRIKAHARSVEQGLAKFVLTLIELLRRWLEKQSGQHAGAGRWTNASISVRSDV